MLLRAAEPIDGVDRMRRARRTQDTRLLCAGPGRLTQALAITGNHNGTDLVAGRDLNVTGRDGLPDEAVRVATRIGLTVARDQPWRFLEGGSRFVSRGRTAGEPLRRPR